MIPIPIYGQDPGLGLEVQEASDSSVRFTLEAIRGAPDGIGAALALLEMPRGELRLRVCWVRLEAYCDPAEDWQNLWFQFGALPGRQHPIFYVRPGAQGYELGWNVGPAASEQFILATIAGSPMIKHQKGVRRIHFADARIDLGLTEDMVTLADAGGYVGSFRLKSISQYGEIGRDWLGFYCEGSKVDVLVQMESS